MRAPVGNDAIGAIWRIAPAAVSHNRVIWNAGRYGKFVYREHKPIVRLQRIDAIRHAFQRRSGGIVDQKRFDFLVNRGKEPGRSDETCTNPSKPAGGEPAAAMRWCN